MLVSIYKNNITHLLGSYVSLFSCFKRVLVAHKVNGTYPTLILPNGIIPSFMHQDQGRKMFFGVHKLTLQRSLGQTFKIGIVAHFFG